MKKNKKSIFIILTLVAIISYSSSFIKFKYHVWYLSSELLEERDNHAQRISDMGEVAIPLIMDQLKHPHIFEEYYLLSSLSEITGIDSVKSLSVKRQKQYWKNWWQNNKNQYYLWGI